MMEITDRDVREHGWPDLKWHEKKRLQRDASLRAWVVRGWWRWAKDIFVWSWLGPILMWLDRAYLLESRMGFPSRWCDLRVRWWLVVEREIGRVMASRLEKGKHMNILGQDAFNEGQVVGFESAIALWNQIIEEDKLER